MVNSQPDRVKLKHGDLVGLWRLAYQDKLDNGKRVDTLLADLPTKEWDAQPNLRMFACVGSVVFFKYLLHSLVFQNGLMSMGRCEMYLCMPPPTFIVIYFRCQCR